MLNELSISQLKYISENLDNCSRLIKSATQSRIERDIDSGNSALVIKRDTQKFSPSDYYKLRYLTSEITLFYDGKKYYICFTGVKLVELQSFFQYLEKNYLCSEYNFNQIVFDKFGVFSLPLIPSGFEYYVMMFTKYCNFFLQYKLLDYQVLF